MLTPDEPLNVYQRVARLEARLAEMERKFPEGGAPKRQDNTWHVVVVSVPPEGYNYYSVTLRRQKTTARITVRFPDSACPTISFRGGTEWHLGEIQSALCFARSVPKINTDELWKRHYENLQGSQK